LFHCQFGIPTHYSALITFGRILWIQLSQICFSGPTGLLFHLVVSLLTQGKQRTSWFLFSALRVVTIFLNTFWLSEYSNVFEMNVYRCSKLQLQLQLWFLLCSQLWSCQRHITVMAVLVTNCDCAHDYDWVHSHGVAGSR
jgi:hypothetical protein